MHHARWGQRERKPTALGSETTLTFPWGLGLLPPAATSPGIYSLRRFMKIRLDLKLSVRLHLGAQMAPQLKHQMRSAGPRALSGSRLDLVFKHVSF